MQARLYILEGPDGSGKTTLMGELVKWLTGQGRKVQAFHHGPYKGEELIGWRFFSSMKSALVQRADVVLDRCWLSDDIYGPAYRGQPSRITPAERHMLERAAITCGAALIACDPGRETVLRNWRSRLDQEMVQDEAIANKVYDGYSHLFESFGSSTPYHPLAQVYYDYTQDDMAEVFRTLEDVAEVDKVAPYPMAGNYRSPKAVILGDRANHPTFERPFFSFLRSGCSWWLAERLEEAGVPGHALLWANTHDCKGSPYGAELVERLKPALMAGAKVFTLGTKALDWASQHLPDGLALEPHHHPMYWKRFRYSEPYPLAKALADHLRG